MLAEIALQLLLSFIILLTAFKKGRYRTSPSPRPMADIPPFLSKSFKLSQSAKRKMAVISDDVGRICQLDASDNQRVLTWKASKDGGFDEMNWSQKTLHEAAQNDPSMRISRKKIERITIEIKQVDLYNEAEQEKYKDHPNMANSLVEVKLGFFQKERYEYIYIISKKSGG